MSTEHWADGVDQLLAEVGRATGASRVWIFQLLDMQPDAVVQDYVFEWASSPAYRQLTQRRFRFFASSLDDPEYRQLVEQRRAGMCHDIQVPAMSPGPLRKHLESQGILSMATVPISVEGRWWGTLGIDDCERDISWQGPGLDLLRASSELIAAAIYRHHLTSRSRQIELFHKVADCGVWEVTLRNGRVWCSRALKVALGYPATYPRVPLRRMLTRIHVEDRRLLWALLRECLATGRRQCRLDVRLDIVGSSHPQWHEIVAEVTHDDRGEPQGIAGLVIDISQRKQNEQHALAASELDALTGTLNRRGMARYLREQHARGGVPIGCNHYLLLLDIDHFKQINDQHGHPVGDVLLQLLTRRIRHELRPDDGLVRLGGEEFAILVGPMTDRQAVELADRVRMRVSGSAFQIALHDTGVELCIELSVSIGVAELPVEAGDSGEQQALALGWADQALYAAKGAGRNRIMVHGVE
ncbi:diguanylate cyclase [Halomonas urumqiensis]|nr:diguanylate cyclase [Halomonas urumqiensis]GHE22446.1 diguanylate cyclase [Halomonas urumqiensis]